MGIVTVTTIATDIEEITKDKLNGLTANLVSEFNGNIENVNFKSTAAVAASKLSLATIAQDVTVTGELVSSESTTAACTVLTNSGNGPHINFTGDPVIDSPTDGDWWFDGSEIKVRIGSTTYNLDKSIESGLQGVPMGLLLSLTYAS